MTDNTLEITILVVYHELVFNDNWSVFKIFFKDTNIKLISMKQFKIMNKLMLEWKNIQLKKVRKIYDIVPKVNSFIKEKYKNWILIVKNFEETYDDIWEFTNETGSEKIIKINQIAYNRFIS